jgi:hypothetical protein
LPDKQRLLLKPEKLEQWPFQYLLWSNAKQELLPCPQRTIRDQQYAAAGYFRQRSETRRIREELNELNLAERLMTRPCCGGGLIHLLSGRL